MENKEHCPNCRSGYTQSPLSDLCASCPCHTTKEEAGRCCKECRDSDLLAREICVLKDCRCHTIAPTAEAGKKCGNCKQPFQGETLCPHAPTTQSWEMKFREEFPHFEQSIYRELQDALISFICKEIAATRSAVLESVKKEIMNRINSAGGIGGLRHLEEIIDAALSEIKK